MREAHRLLGGRPARAPWLAPLPARWCPSSPAGGPGQRAGKLAWWASSTNRTCNASRHWRGTPLTGPGCSAGGSGSGRTTALRALALAASADAGPDALHLHVIDAHGSLGDLAALPHLGTSVPSDDPRGCRRPHPLPARGGGPSPRRRRARSARLPRRRGRPTVLVLVDGWDQLVEAQPPHGPDLLTGALLRVLRDGRAVGVVGAVTGGRSLLHPRWGEVAGRTFLLGSIDPLDAALAGLRAADVPRDPPPGPGGAGARHPRGAVRPRHRRRHRDRGARRRATPGGRRGVAVGRPPGAWSAATRWRTDSVAPPGRTVRSTTTGCCWESAATGAPPAGGAPTRTGAGSSSPAPRGPVAPTRCGWLPNPSVPKGGSSSP